MKYAEAFAAAGVPLQNPGEIAATLMRAFSTPDTALVGVHVECRDKVKLLKDVHEGCIL